MSRNRPETPFQKMVDEAKAEQLAIVELTMTMMSISEKEAKIHHLNALRSDKANIILRQNGLPKSHHFELEETAKFVAVFQLIEDYEDEGL